MARIAEDLRLPMINGPLAHWPEVNAALPSPPGATGEGFARQCDFEGTGGRKHPPMAPARLTV